MARVVIFDSGVGGLSIYAAVQQRLPGLELIFVSDNQCYPYGNKNADQLIPRVTDVMHWVHESLHPDLIIIACNTASTLVLPTLREAFSTPFVGVVPAIKPAAERSQSRVIALLATPATIARPYTDDLIAKFAADCKVIKVGSSVLVEQAEAKLRGQAVDRTLIQQELGPILAREDCDILVLACTHFPLLNKEIEEVINVKYPPSDGVSKISLIDSGEAIARRTEQLLQEKYQPASNTNTCLTTRDISHQTEFLANLSKRGLSYRGVLTSTSPTLSRPTA